MSQLFSCIEEHLTCARDRHTLIHFDLSYLRFWWQVELQYQHEYAGISTSIGLTANPIVNFSGVVGNNAVSLGTDLSFDTASGNFTKVNAGLSYTLSDLIASLTVWVFLFTQWDFFLSLLNSSVWVKIECYLVLYNRVSTTCRYRLIFFSLINEMLSLVNTGMIKVTPLMLHTTTQWAHWPAQLLVQSCRIAFQAMRTPSQLARSMRLTL
jgi:hypothetical protein